MNNAIASTPSIHYLSADTPFSMRMVEGAQVLLIQLKDYSSVYLFFENLAGVEALAKVLNDFIRTQDFEIALGKGE